MVKRVGDSGADPRPPWATNELVSPAHGVKCPALAPPCAFLGRLFPYGAGESITVSSPQRINEPGEDKAVAVTASATGALAVSVDGAAAAADPIAEKTGMVGTIIDREAAYAVSTSDLARYRAPPAGR
jgi:hypothetical protein